MEKIINLIKNRKLRRRGRWYHSILFSEIFSGESTEFNRKIGLPFEKSFSVWLSNGDYYDFQEEWDTIKKIVTDNFSIKFAMDYANKCLEMGEEIIVISKLMSKIDVSKLTDTQLGEQFNFLIKKNKSFMPFMSSLHLFDEYLTERFDTLLKNYTNEDFFKLQTILTLPYKKIFVLEEKQALMELAVSIQKMKLDMNHIKVHESLKLHTKEYGWINNTLLESKPYTFRHFQNRLLNLLNDNVEEKFNLMIEKECKLREKQSKLMIELKGTELHDVARIVQIFGFLRSFRVDVPFKACGHAWDFFEEIGSRLGVHSLDIKFLDSTEISKALAGWSEYKTLISLRKKEGISVHLNNSRYEFIGDEAKLINDSLAKDEPIPKDYVKGQIAFPGELKARCKVLYSTEDMSKVENGDIIVVSMTDPNYIPAMEKASAFVTDFGGILCHAAIIAREMKKPCVIGTKNATKVFKDGDILYIKDNIVKRIP